MNQPIKDAPTLNGLIPATMEAVAAEVAADPDKGRLGFGVQSTWEGATRIGCRVPGFELAGQRIERPFDVRIDEPSELLGSDTAPNPQQLLLSALAGCLSVTLVDHGTMMGIAIDELAVDIAGELDLRGVFGLDPDTPPGFAAFTCEVRIRAEASREQLEELLAAACSLSPTYWQISRSAPIHTELTVLPA
jgi:uncharacterized OsmC-like protein